MPLISDVERVKYKSKASFCISEPRSLYRVPAPRLCAGADERNELDITLCSWHRRLYGLTKAVSNMTSEYSATAMQIERHERWLKQLADKVGVELKE